MATRRVAVAAVALGLLVACARQDDAVTDPTTTTSTTTTTSVFRSTVGPVSAEDLGASWTDGIGCTPPTDLAAIDMTHWGFDGEVRHGRLIVAADVADGVVAVFTSLFEHRFPIERMEPVSVYDGDDDASMRANNTSGYNCRTIAGTNRLSQHARGLAIDVNPLVNPWVHDGRVDPPEGETYADRSRTDLGIIHAGDAVVTAFEAQGWSWGGYWDEPDYQHFSTTGR